MHTMPAAMPRSQGLQVKAQATQTSLQWNDSKGECAGVRWKRVVGSNVQKYNFNQYPIWELA